MSWDKVLATLIIWSSMAVMSYTVKNSWILALIIFSSLVVSTNIWINKKEK